jgi:hypothetical protein
VRRIEAEARAFANADSTTRQIRWGRVLGFLEVGTHLGFWPKRTADQVADAIAHRYRISRVRRHLQR